MVAGLLLMTTTYVFSQSSSCYIFLRVILYIFFSFLLAYDGLGFRFYGPEFLIDGVWGLWCRVFRVFGIGGLHSDVEE